MWSVANKNYFFLIKKDTAVMEDKVLDRSEVVQQRLAQHLEDMVVTVAAVTVVAATKADMAVVNDLRNRTMYMYTCAYCCNCK